MSGHKIDFDKDSCLGCGACAAVCPENWELQPDGKSKPKKTHISDSELRCNEEAAGGCPAQCIKISKL